MPTHGAVGCSYLDLESHPYRSAPAHCEAEDLLTRVFERPTLLIPAATLGHIAALPVLVGEQDALILDEHAHNGVQLAAGLTSPRSFRLLPHNDIGRLDRWIAELSRQHRQIWLAVDGLYGRYGDFAPIAQINAFVERYEQLWLYIDDAHGLSWTGRHGRGHALEHLSPPAAARCVVVGSLVPSFAAGGGVLTFPDRELLTRVFTAGGPMMWSGPGQLPMLAAVIASARRHLSPELPARQHQFLRLIRHFNRRAGERGLRLVNLAESPIRCLNAGRPEVTERLSSALRCAGYSVDVATFPAVSARRTGLRITLTTHLDTADVNELVDAITSERF
jgi:7-keto-8-aminopelargonate synthetase-like enzyme